MVKIVVQVEESSDLFDYLSSIYEEGSGGPHGPHIKSYVREDPERPGHTVVQTRIKKRSLSEALDALHHLLKTANKSS